MHRCCWHRSSFLGSCQSRFCLHIFSHNLNQMWEQTCVQHALILLDRQLINSLILFWASIFLAKKLTLHISFWIICAEARAAGEGIWSTRSSGQYCNFLPDFWMLLNNRNVSELFNDILIAWCQYWMQHHFALSRREACLENTDWFLPWPNLPLRDRQKSLDAHFVYTSLPGRV